MWHAAVKLDDLAALVLYETEHKPILANSSMLVKKSPKEVDDMNLFQKKIIHTKKPF